MSDHDASSARRGLATVALAIALVLGMFATHATPAAAVWPVQYVGRGGCPADSPYVNPWGRVWMKELGKSGVTRFKAKFRLYRTNVSSYGWNYPRLEKTYYSGSFPNNNLSYGGWVPYNGNHQWTYVNGTNSYRMDAKVSWMRPWRRDYTYQYTITYCRAQGV